MAFSLARIFGGSKSDKPDQVVGIDIGSSSVKVVELANTERALMLRTYGELQLGPYANEPLGQAVRLDDQRQIEAVVDVLRESRVEAKRGVLAMPLSSSFVTVIPLAAGNEEDMESKINVEARKFIPLPLSDVTLNWTVLDSFDGPKSATTEVLLAAIENKSLTDYKQLLTSIKMASEPSEIEVFSVVRALAADKEGVSAIIDIGAKTSKLYLVRDGSLQRVHRAAAGGIHVNNRLMQLLNVSFEEAENIKRTQENNSPHIRDVQNALFTVMEGPLREFGRIIERFEVRSGSKVESIMICGGMSNAVSVPKMVEDILVKPVTRANPFNRVAYPAFMEDEIAELAPSFGTALGAALRLFE